MNDISLEQFELIEKFLLNKMGKDEKINFLSEMESDLILAENVSAQSLMLNAVETGALLSQLETITSAKSVARVITFRKIIAVAACVTFLFAGTWMYNIVRNQHEDIYAMLATPDPGLPVPMSSSNAYAFYDAMVDYKNEKYELAISKWQPLLITDLTNDTLKYYLASSYFNLNKLDEAKDYYLMVRAKENSVFYEKAGFYIALIAYSQKDANLMNTVSSDKNSLYHEKMEKLRKALDEER